jgi:septum formation protein
MRLVLASASPRRAELLAAAGFTFTVSPVDVDERARPDEAAADYVRRLASEKSARALDLLTGPAQAGPHVNVGRSHADSVNANIVGSGFSRVDDVTIIGADTVVVVDDQILGKPRNDDVARDMLRRLSSRPHEVITGVSVRSSERELSGLETTRVWCAPLTLEEIEWYIATGEGQDKAGAYAIQGRASRFILRIEGSYSNVVGLPIALVNALVGRLLGSD